MTLLYRRARIWGRPAPGTVWRHALLRVDRRARAYLADATPANRALLVEACRTANTLAARVGVGR